MFGADLWASDWNPRAEAGMTLIAARLAGKGIICSMTPAQTAAMLAAFLRYLKDNGYHVVHVTGALLIRQAP